VPGEDEFTGRGVSYCASCDGPFFKNKKIFVSGGGDAACDEARFLCKISTDINLIVRRDSFRAQKAVSDRILKEPNIKVHFCTKIAAIKGKDRVTSVVLEKNNEQNDVPADAVFVFVGIVPNTKLAGSAKLDSGGFIITDQKMESSVKGLFAAGDVRSSPFRQVIVAAGEGAVAAHSAGEYLREKHL
jgi:thioredoxin reductase (NADPH)